MGICQSGIDRIIQPGNVLIDIHNKHPLLQLGRALPWKDLVEIIMPDLKKTCAGQWWVGRKLKVRIHLGAYFLQQLFNKTDRQIEYDVKDNAAYQIFCGRNVVKKWHVPDHTKIEKFRSRLSEETQKRLANKMALHAVRLGFADCSEIDIDSTVQESNMAYPADSCLLKKLGAISSKVAGFLNDKFEKYVKDPITVNMKKISKAARGYFFLPKTSTKEVKNEKMHSLLNIVKKEINVVLDACAELNESVIKEMPWNIKKTIYQLNELARQYLLDVKEFLTTGVIVPTKRLSFHLQKVACFTKGKLSKKYQFGRLIQLGRIKGNFFIACKSMSVQMPDKKSILPMIKEHENIFGMKKLNSVSTDKGYYSNKNEKFLARKGVKEICIQRPGNIKKSHPKPIIKSRQEELINRRSGIEPLIGHIKQGGQLGRSRMKSDNAIESSGYTAVLGFNLRQIIRHQKMADGDKVA